MIRVYRHNTVIHELKYVILPERYGISSIDIGPDTDFNLTYDYSVSSGLTSSEALNLSITSREKLAREYKSKKFFKQQYCFYT